MLRHCPLACGLMQLKGRADVASLAGAVSARAGHGAEAFCHDSDAAACASWASQGQVRESRRRAAAERRPRDARLLLTPRVGNARPPPGGPRRAPRERSPRPGGPRRPNS